MSTEPSRRLGLLAASLAVAVGVAACAEPAPHASPGTPDASSWSVTAWGERYEISPEVDALEAGETARAHVHVTTLDGFEPLEQGRVALVLRRDAGSEQVFETDEPDRPGVFTVPMTPETPGVYDLLFRIDAPAGSEEIRGGRVEVGTVGSPGGVRVAPAPRGATGGSEPLAFLKEEQWRVDFATAWVRRGALARSVGGPGRLRPRSGGDVRLTARVDGTLGATPWPYRGQAVEAGEVLFRLAPRVVDEESLAHLRAEARALEEDLQVAQAQRDRLERLWDSQVVSLEEVEEARARAAAVHARLEAARQDLESARSAREGTGSGVDELAVRAPFAGRIAHVAASPGAAVEAGELVARLVDPHPVWLDAALAPEDAVGLADPADPAHPKAPTLTGIVLHTEGGSSHRLESDQVRWVSRSPEIDPETGKLHVLFELRDPTLLDRLPLGSAVDARVLLGSTREGVVIPASALVDDGGEPVVYLQLAGERFVRQAVAVVERQGDRVLVEGLVPGQRLVTRGGAALRRSALLAGGSAHGHVH